MNVALRSRAAAAAQISAGHMTLTAAGAYAVAGAWCAMAIAQPAATRPAPREDAAALTRAAREDLLSTPLGPHDLRVLNLPEDFARRAADRALRAEYQSQFHVVVPDPGAGAPASTSAAMAARPAANGPPAAKPSRLGGILLVAAAAMIAITTAVLMSRSRRRQKQR